MQRGTRSSEAHLTSPNIADVIHASGDAEENAERGGDRRGPHGPSQEGVADSRHASMAIPAVGRATKQLVKDPDRAALDHTSLTNLLTWMLKELHGDIVQRFNSTPSMNRLEGQLNPVSTFHLEISLRGQTSLEMYEAFAKLASNAVTGLIGVSIKKDRLPQSNLAKQLARITYQRR